MRLSRIVALLTVSVSLVSCGQAGPELTKTASGTWMSPRVQGEQQVILSTATAAEGQGVLSLTVMDLTTGYIPKGELLKRPDEGGMQIVRVGVKVANVGTQDVEFRYDRLALSMKNGTQGRLSFFVNQQNASDFLQSKLLKPTDTVEGAVYFELPATAVRGDMLLEYKGKEAVVALPLIK